MILRKLLRLSFLKMGIIIILRSNVRIKRNNYERIRELLSYMVSAQ